MNLVANADFSLQVDPSGGSAYTPVGFIKDSVDSTESADDIEVTNLGDVYKSYVRGEIEPGELTWSIAFDPSDGTNQTLRSLMDSGDEASWQINLPGGSSVELKGYVKSLGRSIVKNGVMMRSVGVKLNGAPSVGGA